MVKKSSKMIIFVAKTQETMRRHYFRNPMIWLLRVRHRRGYGVHSPFAFGFITGVIYQRWPYYAYAELARLHPWWVRLLHLRPMQCCRLLFRLANYAEAHTVCLVGATATELEYVRAAVPSADIRCGQAADIKPADFALVAAEDISAAQEVVGQMPLHGMLVVEGIHDSDAHLTIWQNIKGDAHAGVTFDLYDYGIVFFDQRLTKQHYVVNF